MVELEQAHVPGSHLDGHDRMNFKKFRWARPSEQNAAEIGRSPGRETFVVKPKTATAEA